MTTDSAKAAARGKTIKVALGDRAYDIRIDSGLIHNIGPAVATLRPGARAAIVTDETVAGLHLSPLEESLRTAGVDSATITVPAGEGSKSFSVWKTVVEALLDGRFERDDLVLALGGGVVGDLAGFAAAVTRRGMDIVQVPTTLLAQVDSSVGGKTGINTSHGKNLIGAFHQPAAVYIDPDLLETLPDRELAAGYAEVVKVALIKDAPFFDRLEREREAFFEGDTEVRAATIADACLIKADTVAEDEREGGNRALLNLGHTFGHAIEAAVSYQSERIIHGEAVAIGLVLAYAFSSHLGLAPAEDAYRVVRHLSACGLPTVLSDVPGPKLDVATLMTHIGQDKKVTRGQLTFVLTKGIGKAFIARDVEPENVAAFLQRMIES